MEDLLKGHFKSSHGVEKDTKLSDKRVVIQERRQGSGGDSRWFLAEGFMFYQLHR